MSYIWAVMVQSFILPLRADGKDIEVDRAPYISWEDRGRARLFSVWVVLKEREKNGAARQLAGG